MTVSTIYTSVDGLQFSTAEKCEKHEAEVFKKRDTEFVPYIDVLEKMAEKMAKMAGERPKVVFNPVLRTCVARIVTNKTRDGERIFVDATFSGMHLSERPVFKVYSFYKGTLRLRTLATLQFYRGTDRLSCLNARGCYEEFMSGTSLSDITGSHGVISFSVEPFINRLYPIIYDKEIVC